MDPISALFAALLDSTSSAVSNHIQESVGTEVKSFVVDHNDQLISYQHQMWRIRVDSVCADKRERIDEFSKCTLAAKDHFFNACQYLQENNEGGVRYGQLKNMYCSASSSFRPTIASIASSSKASPLELAKRKCSRLTFDKTASAESRNQACARYRALKSEEH